MDKSSLSKKLCALTSLLSSTPYNINWLKDREFGAAVSKWCAEKSYDLVHCDTISLAPYIKGLPQVALSLDHHNVESQMLLRRSRLEANPFKKFYFLARRSQSRSA
jgi:hypothetical protein